MESSSLTEKDRQFVREYLVDLNGTQAYLRMYPSASYESARVSASRMLANVNIREAIFKAMKERESRTNITSDRVLREIARLAFTDARAVFDANGNMLPVKDWPDEVAAAVSSIKFKRNSESEAEMVEIRFWDKGKALEMAGRHLGIFEKDNNQKTSLNLTLKKP